MSRSLPQVDRQAPALHRAMPTWCRKVEADGAANWRLYVRDSPGVARFCYVKCPASTERAVAARVLQRCRQVLWGRNPDLDLNALAGMTDAELIADARQQLERDRAPAGVQGCLF